MRVKASVYALIALAAISCAAMQPETATALEDSAVRLANGEPLLMLDDVGEAPGGQSDR